MFLNRSVKNEITIKLYSVANKILKSRRWPHNTTSPGRNWYWTLRLWRMDVLAGYHSLGYWFLRLGLYSRKEGVGFLFWNDTIIGLLR